MFSLLAFHINIILMQILFFFNIGSSLSGYYMWKC